MHGTLESSVGSSSAKSRPNSVLNKFRRGVALTGIASAIIAGAATSQAADKHPFGIDDYSALHSAHAIAISTDGRDILYDVRTDGATGPTKHEWRLIDVSGEHSRKLDLPEKFEPAGFTKNSALFGAYGVEKLGQLAIVPLADGKPTLIIALPSGIHGASISPDGAWFALLADSRPKDPLDGVHTVVGNDDTSLYVVRADGTNGAWWCRDLNFITDVAWSNDASQIAVVTQTPKIGFHELHSFVNVCTAAGSRRLAEIPNSTSGIAWSGDGKELIFAATATPTLTPEHVWSVPAAGGSPVDRTPQLESTAATVKQDPHGTVWVEMHRGVITEVRAFQDGRLESRYTWPRGVFETLPVMPAFTASPEVLAFSVEDPQHATNVAVESGDSLKKITHEGDDTLANVSLGDVKIVKWTSKEGIRLEGIATFPPAYTPGKKYPFLVFPHGGPEANDTFNSTPSRDLSREWVT